MAEIEAFAASLQDVSGGPRFASVKIDSANLERVLSNRDGTFIVTRIRGALGFDSRFSPIWARSGLVRRSKFLTFVKVSAYSQA